MQYNSVRNCGRREIPNPDKLRVRNMETEKMIMQRYERALSRNQVFLGLAAAAEADPSRKTLLSYNAYTDPG